jgi:hypothetical protein
MDQIRIHAESGKYTTLKKCVQVPLPSSFSSTTTSSLGSLKDRRGYCYDYFRLHHPYFSPLSPVLFRSYFIHLLLTFSYELLFLSCTALLFTLTHAQPHAYSLAYSHAYSCAARLLIAQLHAYSHAYSCTALWCSI